ncbi:hypothetical protein SAMN06269185_3203 [Natronoarchaeum philippinense]|uniref:Uncharacterized protein n=1 Tax=Natronoarchaeum philippinense TaxID=558529 RepID=A0A285PA01_NATPI|nr:DUF5784 family protein [Natronoarchaeum philippinense]SNZ18033.1 hypothetical protein SAMN06269185_3203 [Natronoarchaeum philippinense]
MASPLRFRKSTERWTPERVRGELLAPLDANLGADTVEPRIDPGGSWSVRRFDVDNGDIALFVWRDDEAYWLGNTETPKALWRTDKFGWTEVPYHVARFSQRELLAELYDAEPWLDPYDHLAWFFLPVFMSKDGRTTTRTFFRDHAAGFPDADREAALTFYEDFLSTGVFDDERETMAGKLGTSEMFDRVRMTAAMGEFNAAKLLSDAGYGVTPEIAVGTGHSLDFRATPTGARAADGGIDSDDGESSAIVEVTRPQPPTRRTASTPSAAVRETADSKASGQLSEHGDAVLFVDCSSFRDDEWLAVRGERPALPHRPAVVFRARPSGRIEGYASGNVPLDLGGGIELV